MYYKAFVEMPKGTQLKYEIDKENGHLVLDRPIKTPIPYNYGFIPNTLCEDSDPLDVFVITSEAIPPLTEIKLVPAALIYCTDRGVTDNKLVGFLYQDDPKKYNLAECIDSCIEYLEKYKFGMNVEQVEYDQSLIAELIKKYSVVS